MNTMKKALVAIIAAVALVLSTGGVSFASTSGYPYPTAATTGIPAGTTLTPLNGNGLCGTYKNKVIDGDAIITCDSTFVNTRIKGRVDSQGGRYRVTLRHSDVGYDSCPAKTGDYQLIRGPFTISYTHIHNNAGQDPVAIWPGAVSTMNNSLIDQTCFYPGDHLDGVQYYAPGEVATAKFVHNTVDVRPVNSSDNGNSAFLFADTPGAGTKITLNDNLLAGGNYTLFLLDAYRGSGVSYVVKNNVFVKGSYTYRPCTTNSPVYNGTDGVQFVKNTYDDGTTLTSC